MAQFFLTDLETFMKMARFFAGGAMVIVCCLEDVSDV